MTPSPQGAGGSRDAAAGRGSPARGGFFLRFFFCEFYISVPPRCRKDDAAVEMDEMVAAMVLTSLSCSPVVQSPPASDSGIPRECALKKKTQKKPLLL